MGTNGSDPNPAEAIQSAQDALQRSYLTARSQMVGDHAVKVARDAVRSYLDPAIALSRGWLTLWRDTAQTTLRAAFDVQDASLRASRTVFDIAPKGNAYWLDHASEAVRTGQEVTAEMVAASFAAIASALPGGRRR